MRQVVVTGLGAISPLADGVDRTWNRLINSKSGLGAISGFEASDLPSRVAGQVPVDPNIEGSF